ncbi:MAG TPA: FAD-dependent oxidoreductase [Gemmatimonadaceae bacterium]|nr:FAD-dependent oxidoreductase [Gemmatimonadaceae bacterium]
MTVEPRADAIVVGAGIVGAACARALAREGMRVTVLEGGFAGGGTTAAGMGHLVVMDDSPAQLALTALSVELWKELSPSLGASVEFDPCGTLWIAEDAQQMDVLREKERVYRAFGIACEMIDRRRLVELEPNLRAGLAGALLVAGDAVLYATAAARWLLDDARAFGAVIREQCMVDEISGHAVRIGTEMLEADVIVNAAGVRSAQLTLELPIIPRKGHLAITDRAPGFCRHQLVELGYFASAHGMTSESVAFNVQPRPTGQVVIGSSRELVGWDASINHDVLRRMLDRAGLFMPALSRLAVARTWTGFRPATPDKLPLIGRWEATEGLWIATGHEGLGVTASLGTARLIADLVVGRRPPIDATAFAPARVLTRPAC